MAFFISVRAFLFLTISHCYLRISVCLLTLPKWSSCILPIFLIRDFNLLIIVILNYHFRKFLFSPSLAWLVMFCLNVDMLYWVLGTCDANLARNWLHLTFAEDVDAKGFKFLSFPCLSPSSLCHFSIPSEICNLPLLQLWPNVILQPCCCGSRYGGREDAFHNLLIRQ